MLRPFRPPTLRICGIRQASRISQRQRPSQPLLRARRSPGSKFLAKTPLDDSQNASAQFNPPPQPPSLSESLAAASPQENGLLAPVHIPEDLRAVIKSDHPSTAIIANSGLVVQRQFEMLNIFLGFEQANRYVILDPQGNHIGYMAEHDGGLGKGLGRQVFRTHRAFTTNIFTKMGKEVLKFHRPFSVINSRIRVYDACEPAATASSIPTSPTTAMAPAEPLPNSNVLSNIPQENMRIIGETQQEWAALRRKYNLFSYRSPPASRSSFDDPQVTEDTLAVSSPAPEGTYHQFAYVDEPFLSWDFSLCSSDSRLLGSVNRNFAGFGRELFTDTGVYALRMDSAAEATADPAPDAEPEGKQSILGPVEGMTLDQRAVMLATAVSIDFDYFSRHSGHGSGMPLPMWFPFGGGGGEAGAEAGEMAGAETGAAVGGGAMAGAGTMAGYEAMQRSGQPTNEAESMPPGQPDDGGYGSAPQNEGRDTSDLDAGEAPDEIWGNSSDPRGNELNENDSGSNDGGGDGGSFDVSDWF